MSLEEIFKKYIQEEEIAALDPKNYTSKLLVNDVITEDELEKINAGKDHNERKIILFLQVLPLKAPTVLQSIIDIFERDKLDRAAEILAKLATEAKILYPTIGGSSSGKIGSVLSEVRQTLRFHLGQDCQELQTAWKEFMLKQSLELSQSYLPVKVVDKENGDNLINTYQDLFGEKLNPSKNRFIVIQGKPGIGKSTYISKLITDWIQGDNELLNSRFDLVFLLRFNEIKSMPEVLTDTAYFKMIGIPPVFIGSLIEAIKSPEYGSRTLFVFDGMDECPEVLEQKHGFVTDLLKNDYSKFITVLMATRPETVMKIPIRNRWLEIMGFEKKTLSDFLKKQQVSQRVFDDVMGDTYVTSVLTTPLFLALFSFLLHEKQLPEKMELYTLLQKSFNHLVYIFHYRDRGNISKDELQCITQCLGRYAHEQSQEHVHEQCINAGLGTGILLKRKKAILGTTGELSDTPVFLHSFFQEFLGTAYVLKANDFESKDIQVLMYNVPSFYFYSGHSVKLRYNAEKYLKNQVQNGRTCMIPYMVDATEISGRLLHTAPFNKNLILGFKDSACRDPWCLSILSRFSSISMKNVTCMTLTAVPFDLKLIKTISEISTMKSLILEKCWAAEKLDTGMLPMLSLQQLSIASSIVNTAQGYDLAVLLVQLTNETLEHFELGEAEQYQNWKDRLSKYDVVVPARVLKDLSHEQMDQKLKKDFEAWYERKSCTAPLQDADRIREAMQWNNESTSALEAIAQDPTIRVPEMRSLADNEKLPLELFGADPEDMRLTSISNSLLSAGAESFFHFIKEVAEGQYSSTVTDTSLHIDESQGESNANNILSLPLVMSMTQKIQALTKPGLTLAETFQEEWGKEVREDSTLSKYAKKKILIDKMWDQTQDMLQRGIGHQEKFTMLTEGQLESLFDHLHESKNLKSLISGYHSSLMTEQPVLEANEEWIANLRHFENLELLELSGGGLTHESLSILTMLFKDWPTNFLTLTTLILSNSLAVGTLPDFVSSIGHIKSLQHLDLSSCALILPTVHALHSILKPAEGSEPSLYSSLQRLNLYQNPLVNKVEGFYETVAELPSLQWAILDDTMRDVLKEALENP